MGITRLIGDTHGLHDHYLKLIDNVDYSVQLGDMGWGKTRSTPYRFLEEKVNPYNHRLFAGNHDDYTVNEDGKFCRQTSHFLGDYGVATVGSLTFFFIRGELSVDKHYRVEGLSWWPKEELTRSEALDCLRLYEQSKPDLVLTHGCPSAILPYVITNEWKLAPSYTAQLLQACYAAHAPKRWYFGHHHNNYKVIASEVLKDEPWFKGETVFQCLHELCYLDFDDQGNQLTEVPQGTPVNF